MHKKTNIENLIFTSLLSKTIRGEKYVLISMRGCVLINDIERKKESFVFYAIDENMKQ